jgi:hypothetical protein
MALAMSDVRPQGAKLYDDARVFRGEWEELIRTVWTLCEAVVIGLRLTKMTAVGRLPTCGKAEVEQQQTERTGHRVCRRRQQHLAYALDNCDSTSSN